MEHFALDLGAINDVIAQEANRTFAA